ncbi:MAG: TolC family protein [bacterium]
MSLRNYKISFAGIFLFFGFFLFPNKCISQDTIVLSLNDAISVALDKSYNIKTLEKLVDQAEQNLIAARARYKTNINLNLFAPQYDEGFELIPQVDGNPIPKQQGSFQVRGVMDITQPMPWIPLGGGDLTLQGEAYQLNSWSPMREDPDKYDKSNRFFNKISLIMNKPLFTINNVALELRQAKLNYRKQKKVFTRSELDLIYRITQQFFSLYRTIEEVKINKEDVQRQQNIFETTEKKFKSGLIAEVDAMQAEVDLIQARNSLKSSQGRMERQMASFKQLIGLSLDENIDLTADLEVDRIDINVEKAISFAMNNRSEIVEKEIDIENQEINIKQTNARVSIKGSLMGYYQLSGFSEEQIPWGTSTVDLIESSWEVLKQTPNRGVTFNLEIPLWDWGRNRAQVKAAEIQLERDKMDLEDQYVSIEREVKDVIRSCYESYDRVKMLEKSKEVSQRSFEINLERFENGDITTTELARVSDQLNNSLLSYLDAYNQYKLALADLRRKTLYDFETNESLAEE